MRVALYGRTINAVSLPHVQRVVDKLQESNAQILIHRDFYSLLKEQVKFRSVSIELFEQNASLANKADFLFSIGGDGTLLDTLAFVRNSGIPIMGINTGRLGFLSTVSIPEIEMSIDALANNRHELDERSLVKFETSSGLFGDLNFALNEITIHKKDSSSMISIHAYLNGVFINTYWADGLIVSTPTGSTAYSLSCGGPIMVPQSENFIVTPIAPHNLNVRPIIVSSKDSLTLKVEGRQGSFLVSLDSRSETIDSLVEMTITQEKFKVNLIRLQGQDFFNTLHKKLNWGIDKRN